MKKRMQCLFLCSVILLVSVACKKQQDSYETSKTVETITTSVAETESTTIEATPTRTIPPMTEPFAVIDGFDANGMITSMCNGINDTIVIQCLDNDTNANSCYVFDPIEKKIIRKIALEQTYYSVLGMFSNGTIVVVDDITNKTLYMYSENSDTPREIVLDVDYYPLYQVDRHNDCIYWAESLTGNILKISESGTISTHIPGEDFQSVNVISSSDLVFEASKASEETKSGTEIGLYSLIDGQPKVLLAESNSISFFTTGYCTTTYTQYKEDYCGGDTILQVYDINTNQNCQAYKIEFDEFESYRFEGNSRSDYAVMMYNNYENSEENGELNEIFFVDTKNGTIADSGIEIENKSVYLKCIYSEGIGRWLIAINYMDETPSFSLLMVDPTLMKFDTQMETTEFYSHEKLEEVEFGDDFKKIREEADKIEEEFGVRLLVGDEVKHSEDNSLYIFKSREDAKNFNLDHEMNRMDNLRDVLSMYPKDFFSHFKSKDGKCGLRIAIVDELQSDSYEFFSAAGVSYTTGGWYDIAICGHHILGTSLHHEIWHSVEKLVGNKHGDIDKLEWMELNPEGFEYSTDFDGYATDCSEEQFELILDNVYYTIEPDYEYPYFISDYSKVTDMEDRATIIERLLSTEIDVNGEEHLIDLEKIKMYPHINAKIEFLENWTEQEFGYSYWDKVHEIAKGRLSN